NGHLPEREIVSGVGPIKVRQPRVRHRDGGQFSSAILPKYMRRTPSVDALIPALYLKGISTGDFSEALAAILGEQASGLSATNIVRLKAGWEDDYKRWCQRDLSQKRYVYWWADGIYFNVRLNEERSCVLVLMGALEDGTKELLAVVDGYRESTQSTKILSSVLFIAVTLQARSRRFLLNLFSGGMLVVLRTIVPLNLQELVDGFQAFPKFGEQPASALLSCFEYVAKGDDCASEFGTDCPAQKSVIIKYANFSR